MSEKENPMREVRLEKITLNMGAGESGAKLEKCKMLMENLSGKGVVITRTHKRSTFGMAKGRPIGVKITLRGSYAEEVLKRLLQARGNILKPEQFDAYGNVSFGVDEYINIPGMKYDPDVGIIGLDVAVTLTRPGFRVKRRRIRPGRIGKGHVVTPVEAMEFMSRSFGAKGKEEEE